MPAARFVRVMSERVVLFAKTSPLLLESIKRDASSRILEGWVENGAWQYRREDDTAMALFPSGKVANSWTQSPVDEREVAVPVAMRGDYNKIINWAIATLRRDTNREQAQD